MPTVCKYKPNRSKPRYFKPCDVARIAWNCWDDEQVSDPNVLLACIAKRLGFESIVLHPDYEDRYDEYLAIEQELDGKSIEQIKLERSEQEQLAKDIDELDNASVYALERILRQLFEWLKNRN